MNENRSATYFLKEGLKLAQSAVDKDQAGNKNLAISYYQLAIAEFEKSINHTNDQGLIQLLQKKCIEYNERIDSIAPVSLTTELFENSLKFNNPASNEIFAIHSKIIVLKSSFSYQFSSLIQSRILTIKSGKHTSGLFFNSISICCHSKSKCKATPFFAFYILHMINFDLYEVYPYQLLFLIKFGQSKSNGSRKNQ